MERLALISEKFLEDVNKEDSVIIEMFESIVQFLFKIILVAGVPFMTYVLLQFTGLI
ncbi:hypothetical protein [Mesobacillus subterraneus]|uniref:hypothetical protein n=1 Tax=Mesobacillus subterraneus TaxID=285983 RepID=UPI001473DF63|nr:hypothetical protein [Mesobacillus subterraneus]